jgi:hypothetical protein
MRRRHAFGSIGCAVFVGVASFLAVSAAHRQGFA